MPWISYMEQKDFWHGVLTWQKMALLRMVLAASASSLSNEIEPMSQSAYVKPNVLNCSSILKRFNMFDCIVISIRYWYVWENKFSISLTGKWRYNSTIYCPVDTILAMFHQGFTFKPKNDKCLALSDLHKPKSNKCLALWFTQAKGW